jgi:quercetin dioxygenase-like cupin family protein
MQLRTIVIAACVCVATASLAGETQPCLILPETLQWSSPPWDARVSAAWILGSEKTGGPYLQRVRMAPGGRIPPHWHPDSRYTTVLSGTLRVAFGPEFDPARALVLPPGAVLLAPAGLPHEVWAEEEATYQEAGTGPTATRFVER